jgi:hypothetical protein
MKTKIERTAKDGSQFDIVIRLSDDCHNGHEDFAITGTIHEAGKPKIERYMVSGGAIGDYVAKEFPDLAIFNRLHLCDYAGAPMYAVANGFYNIKRMDVEQFSDYFRCTPVERDMLCAAENEEQFSILLYLSDIPTRWEQEAGEAIKILEGMTGKKWVNNSVRCNFVAPTPEQLADFEVKQKSGYFSDEQRAQRELDKQQAHYKAEREKAESECDGKIKQAEVERDVKIAVLDAGLSLKNFIFYNHTNTGVFNWKDYDDKITREQFEVFVSGVNIEGVKFEMK